MAHSYFELYASSEEERDEIIDKNTGADGRTGYSETYLREVLPAKWPDGSPAWVIRFEKYSG